MLTLILAACTPTTDDKQQDTPADTGQQVVSGTVELSPTTLDFGTISEPSSATVSLVNGTGGTLTVLSATATSGDLSFTLPAQIPPGETGDLVVTWAPLTPVDLSDTIAIETLSTSSGQLDLSLPVTGSAAWPSLALTVEPTDLGVVNVGCTATSTITLNNAGTADLEISGISLLEGEFYELASTDGTELPAFPWTVAVGATTTVNLVYTPDDDGINEDILQVASNDPVQPSQSVDMKGTGYVEGENTMSWIVGARHASTILFAVNEVATYAPFEDRFVESLPYLFDALLDAGVEFRVAFTLQPDGEITGDIPYIDETFSSSDAISAMEEMLTEPGMGDNDTLLDTLNKAIELNRDWLLDESETWSESKLTLVAINSDVEQSTGSASHYVNQYWAYKEDSASVIVNAITGPMPRGCSGAEPAELLDSATSLTGGTLYEICEADWTSYMEGIAEDALGERTEFELEGEPADWSIEVKVNNTAVTEGWTYDSEDVAVVFDEDHYPEEGSEVEIHYLMATSCE